MATKTDDIEALPKGDTKIVNGRRIERTITDGRYHVYNIGEDDNVTELGSYATYSQAEARAQRS